MRKLLLVSAFLFCASFASAQCSNTSYANGWTCVKQKGNGNAGSGNTVTSTFASSTVSGHGVLAFATACYDTSCGGSSGNLTAMNLTIANSASDTVVASPGTPSKSTVTGTTRFLMGAWWFPSVSAITNTTLTCSGGSGGSCWYVTLYVSEWIGGDTSGTPFDKDAFAALASTGTPSIALATTTNATDLVAGFVSGFNSSAFAPGTTPLAFTEIGEDFTGSEHEAVSVTATAAHACKWTNTAQVINGVCIALKAASAGPPATVIPRHRGMVTH